jgi:hypothetical protein
MRNAAAEDPDHHGLDHGEGKQRGYGCVDRVPTGQQHLGTGCGRERVIGHDHAAGSMGRPLLAGKGSNA